MLEHELNSWLYRTLATEGDYLSFDQLDQMLAKEEESWTDNVRRSYLRGELGRMLHRNQIVRDPNAARYKISDDDINLF